jgi:hypothetical protein
LQGFTRIRVSRHQFNEEEQVRKNAKKFLKKGNSKPGLPRGNPDAHRTVMDSDSLGFKGVRMN